MRKSLTLIGWLSAGAVVLVGLGGCGGKSEAPAATTDTEASRQATERYKANNPKAEAGQLPYKPGRPAYAH